MADKIVVLDAGSIVQYDTPLNIYRRPANLFVATFIGSPKMNIIGGRVAAERDAATIGIRPEHLDVGETSGWPGSVVVVEHLGSDTYLHVDTGELGVLVVRKPGEYSANRGTQVFLTPQDENIHRFNPAGQRICG
jgi:multiple sugar transport system ATP-binding protein